MRNAWSNETCSFCGRTHPKVIAGPKVFSCLDCVRLCNESTIAHSPLPASCRCCGEQGAIDELRGGPPRFLCKACLDLRNDLIAFELDRERPR